MMRIQYSSFSTKFCSPLICPSNIFKRWITRFLICCFMVIILTFACSIPQGGIKCQEGYLTIYLFYVFIENLMEGTGKVVYIY